MAEVRENISELVPISEREVNSILKDLEAAGVERSVLKKLWNAYLAEIPDMPKELQLKDTVESREKIILWLCARRKAIDSSNVDEMNLVVQKLFSQKENPSKPLSSKEKKDSIEKADLSGDSIKNLLLLCAKYRNNQEEAMNEYLESSDQDQKAIGANLLQSILTESGVRVEEFGITYTRVDLSLPESIKDKIRGIARQKGYTLSQFPRALSKKGTRNPSIVFLFEPSLKTIHHEINHLLYPGLKIGDWGVGINEALTDQLAIKKIPEKASSVTALWRRRTSERSKIMTETSYPEEMEMYYNLIEQFPDMEIVLDERYQSDTAEKSNAMMKSLLNDIGIDGVLQLYRVLPKNKKIEGSFNASDFTENLKARRKRFDRLNVRE